MDRETIDLKTAKANPSKVFSCPRDVLVHPDLSREAKREILRQWETDAQLLSTAENENMMGGEGNHLSAVKSALLALETPETSAR
jgi:hypothetical protein